jgi:hypothetical protein
MNARILTRKSGMIIGAGRNKWYFRQKQKNALREER